MNDSVFPGIHYFTKCFVDYFGLLPKEYIAKRKKEEQRNEKEKTRNDIHVI